MVVHVDHLGPMVVEIVGPPTSLKVYVGRASKNFDASASLFDILMWIEGVPRNRAFTASARTASMHEDIQWSANEIERSNEILHDVAMTLDRPQDGGESISDVYEAAARVSRDLSNNISRSLEFAVRSLRKLT